MNNVFINQNVVFRIFEYYYQTFRYRDYNYFQFDYEEYNQTNNNHTNYECISRPIFGNNINTITTLSSKIDIRRHDKV